MKLHYLGSVRSAEAIAEAAQKIKEREPFELSGTSTSVLKKLAGDDGKYIAPTHFDQHPQVIWPDGWRLVDVFTRILFKPPTRSAQ